MKRYHATIYITDNELKELFNVSLPLPIFLSVFSGILEVLFCASLAVTLSQLSSVPVQCTYI